MEKNVSILGGGVSGMTCAWLFAKSGWNVKIIAEKFSPSTLSDGTAALWEPYLSNDGDYSQTNF